MFVLDEAEEKCSLNVLFQIEENVCQWKNDCKIYRQDYHNYVKAETTDIIVTQNNTVSTETKILTLPTL